MYAAGVPVFQGKAIARRTTHAEYDRLIDQGFYVDERVELVHGIVVQMSPMGVPQINVLEMSKRTAPSR